MIFSVDGQIQVNRGEIVAAQERMDRTLQDPRQRSPGSESLQKVESREC